MVKKLFGTPADVLGRHFTNRLRPLRRILSHMRYEPCERWGYCGRFVRDQFIISVHLNAADDKGSFQFRIVIRRVEWHRSAGRTIHHKRLARCGISDEQAMWPDQIGRRRAMFEKWQIESASR